MEASGYWAAGDLGALVQEDSRFLCCNGDMNPEPARRTRIAGIENCGHGTIKCSLLGGNLPCLGYLMAKIDKRGRGMDEDVLGIAHTGRRGSAAILQQVLLDSVSMDDEYPHI